MAQISRIYPVVLVMLIAAALTVGIASAAEPNEKVITVSGTGKVTTSPDTVIISVAVETENTDSQKAQKENADKMAQCINALKSIGITDSEMKTTGYTMYSYKSSSDSIFFDSSLAMRTISSSLTCSGTTITRTSRPA